MVEGARLESVCRGNSTVGSNPTLSASFNQLIIKDLRDRCLLPRVLLVPSKLQVTVGMRLPANPQLLTFLSVIKLLSADTC